MSRVAILAATVALLLPVAAHAADHAIGVSVHSLDPALAPAYAEMGARVVRFDVAWSHIVHEGDGEHWERFDAFVDALVRAGINPLAILQWDGPGGLDLPEARAEFARFSGKAAERWPSALFEVLNEPNLTPADTGVPSWRYVSPEDYVLTLAAVREVAPKAVLVGPALGGSTPDLPYAERVLAASAAELLDGFSVHPYGVGLPQDAPAFYESLRATMRRWGREVPILVSEWGFQASEDAQAALLDEAVRVNQESGIGLTVVYRWDNADGFGLMRDDGTARPAFYALRAAANRDGRCTTCAR